MKQESNKLQLKSTTLFSFPIARKYFDDTTTTGDTGTLQPPPTTFTITSSSTLLCRNDRQYQPL